MEWDTLKLNQLDHHQLIKYSNSRSPQFGVCAHWSAGYTNERTETERGNSKGFGPVWLADFRILARKGSSFLQAPPYPASPLRLAFSVPRLTPCKSIYTRI